ncbi:MAG TPA: hypothetical protein VH988_19095 [Thermoanaerobaculia bacterium]|jgi:hypothetical protein|nr:hypothetical protein [Thermoanaerobaculia bacterium]
MKTASFTVRATLAQSERWKRAADAEGYASAGGWLADAADAYLKARVRAGRPIPLAWRRGRFSVRLDGGELVPVSGHMSPPFGSYTGTAEGPSSYSGRHRHTLVFIPDARVIATLRTYRQAQALAAEIAPALLRGALPDSAPIVARHVREAL